MKYKTLVGQIFRTTFAVEAVVMPGIFLKTYHIGAFTKPSDSIFARSTLLGHKVLVAIYTVILVIHSSEPLPAQLLGTGVTNKALSMPGLILVTDPSRCDGLVAFHTLLGKLGLMARHTEEPLISREETFGSNDFLAVAADEAVFMPDVTLVLHILISYHNMLVAPFAFGGGLLSSTTVAKGLAIRGHKGLTDQGLLALATKEAGFVPVAVIKTHLLGICTYGLVAFVTDIGTVLVKAWQAAVVVILLDILLPLQGILAVVAFELARHGAL